MTGLRFLLRVTLRRLDFAEEVYHLREPKRLPPLREPKRLPLVAAGVRKPAQLRTSAAQQGCSNELPQDRVHLSHTADAKLLLIR